MVVGVTQLLTTIREVCANKFMTGAADAENYMMIGKIRKSDNFRRTNSTS